MSLTSVCSFTYASLRLEAAIPNYGRDISFETQGRFLLNAWEAIRSKHQKCLMLQQSKLLETIERRVYLIHSFILGAQYLSFNSLCTLINQWGLMSFLDSVPSIQYCTNGVVV